MNAPHPSLSITDALANIRANNARLNIVMDLAPAASAALGGALNDFSVLVKSNIAVKNLPFTAGIGAFRNRIAKDDAHVVALLRHAGAGILGTVNMEEAALGAVTNNPHFGRTENPRRQGFTAGGSSGGSAAAVAAGFARAALGSDTMGSCRIPAAYCGVVGYKPSYGRISVAGVEPLASRLDHVGLLATSVGDIQTIAQVVCQFDTDCPWSRRYAPLALPTQMNLHHCRFGVLDEPTIAALTPPVEAAYRHALKILHDCGATLLSRAVDQALLAGARRAGLLLCEAALANSLAREYANDDGGLSPQLRAMIAFGTKKSAADLARAIDIIDSASLIERRLLEGVEGINALLWPSAPQTAFDFEQPIPANQADFTCLANFTGAPALSLPLPVPADALPVGLQIMTRCGEDARLLDLSAALERTLAASPPPAN